MLQSGKIVAYSATALSAAAMLGVLVVLVAAPWIGPSAAPGAQSVQVKMPAGAAGTSLAEVRALAAAVSGTEPAATPPLGTGQAGAQSAEPAPPPPEWTPVEVGAALMQCVSLLAPADAEVVPLAPVRYNDCGAPAPVLLRGLGGKDRVAVDPPLVMTCPMVAALSLWLEKIVQPAARATLGSPVARIVGSSYACRNLYNLPNERRSQHAYANAIDLPVFFLADGRKIDLTQGWGPTHRDSVTGARLVPIVAKMPEGDAGGGVARADMKTSPNGASAGMTVVKASTAQTIDGNGTETAPKAAPLPNPLTAPEAKFLRRVHRGACDVFSTVLGPEANDVHRTHLHLDLQDRHALNVCR